MPTTVATTPASPSVASLLPNDPTDWRQLVSRVLAIAILTAAVALERIDVALSGAHRASETSGGFGDIATPDRLLHPDGARAILNGWTSLPDVAETLVWAYGWVDLLLMTALAVWLGWLYRSRGASSTSWDMFTWILRPFWPIYWVPRARQRFADVGWRALLPTLSFGTTVRLYLIFDFLEDAAVIYWWWTVTDGAKLNLPPMSAQIIGVLSLAKWIFLGTSLLILVLHYRTSATSPALQALRSFGRAVLALRGQLAISVVLAAILLALGGDLGRQVDDVLAVAVSRPWPSALIATLTAITASLILTLGGMACLHAYIDPPHLPWLIPALKPRRRMVHGWITGIFAAACLALILIGNNSPDDCRGALFSLAVLFGALAFIVIPAWFRETDTPSSDVLYARIPNIDPDAPDAIELPGWIIPVVADIPMLALFLAIIRASVTTWAAGSSPWELLLWAAILAILWLNVHWVALAWTSGRWDIDEQVNSVSWYWPLILGFTLLAIFVFVPQVGDHWIVFYQWLGTPAVLMLFASTLGLITTGATLLSDSYRPGGVLEALKVRRLPIFTVVIAWGLLASTADVAGAYYVVRTKDAAPERQPITEAFDTWTKTIPTPRPKPTPPAIRAEVPLVFVAAAGGGIRAAYWTRLGMDCVFGEACGNTDTTGRVFLASGVSGGSLGLASTRSRQTAEAAAKAKQDPGAVPDMDTVLGQDFIAPSLAAFLFLDQPNAFLRLPLHGVNRADTLERAWEHADNGLTNQFGSDEMFPKLVLNSTSVEDGCRLEISEVTFAPTVGQRNCAGTIGKLATDEGPGSTPTRDTFAHVCDGADRASAGLALSTAALMSARFPYVSPAGGLRGCKGESRTFALDGGIVDNSGGTAVLNAWQQVAGKVSNYNKGIVDSDNDTKPDSTLCIVPKLVVFDSGRAAGIPPQVDDRPPQFTAPLVAALGGFDRRSSTPIAQAAYAIGEAATEARRSCHPIPDPDQTPVDVVVISPNEQPAPGIPLGWTLSFASRTQMRCQMGGTPLALSANLDACAAFVNDDLDDVKKVWAWFGARPA